MRARPLTLNMNMRPQHITITSIKYLISYPINMKVSNQVFTTSNSNKCVGGLCLIFLFLAIDNDCDLGYEVSVRARFMFVCICVYWCVSRAHLL